MKRGDYIKLALSQGEAFVAHPGKLQAVVNAVNAGLPQVQEAEKYANNSVEYETVKNVAIIHVDGGMYKRDMSGACMNVASYDQITKARIKAEEDASVDTILFNVDTPGGSVAGVDEMGEGIYTSKKKTVTIFSNMGASGGIWGFTTADEVYATETTRLGSIGVVVTFEEDPESEEKNVTIVSKNATNKRCKIGENCRAEITETINRYEEMFFARVERNTGFNAEKIKSTFNNGGMIFAKEAKEAGFIKDIVTFKDLLASLVKEDNALVIELDNLGGNSTNVESIAVPTDNVKVADNSSKGANMEIAWNDDNLEQTKLLFSSLVKNKAKIEGENADLQINLNTASTSLEAKGTEIATMKVDFDKKLSEGVEAATATATAAATTAFEAQTVDRVKLAISENINSNPEAVAGMITAENDDEALKISLAAKPGTQAVVQTTGDAVVVEDSKLLAYAKANEGSLK